MAAAKLLLASCRLRNPGMWIAQLSCRCSSLIRVQLASQRQTMLDVRSAGWGHKAVASFTGLVQSMLYALCKCARTVCRLDMDEGCMIECSGQHS